MLRVSFKSFRRAESGVASVEFALISTVLLLLFAGGFDIVYMVTAKRDADRASVLIAHAMATCPNSSCMSELTNDYPSRKANALIRYPNAKVEMYMIQYKDNTITPCSGTLTKLTDPDLLASAKNILRDKDVGSAVMVTTSYSSILPNMLMSYISSTGTTYTGRTIDVMGNIGTVC